MSVRFTGLKSQSGPVLHPQLMLKKCGNFIKKKKINGSGIKSMLQCDVGSTSCMRSQKKTKKLVVSKLA